MFALNLTQEIRGVIIDIAFGLLPIAPITVLKPEKIIQFKKDLRVKYFVDAESFCPKPPSNDGSNVNAHPADSNWPRLCIFIPRYLGTNMHDDVELINGLLRLVEAAFRSKNTDHIASAYDCWKELMDNYRYYNIFGNVYVGYYYLISYRLNWEYLCGSRQIRLLIKPLKIKLSRCEQVLWKRFDLWLHLLRSLRTKAVYCVEDFLRFCYSPFYESVKGGETHEPGKPTTATAVNPTKIYKSLWPKMTDALIGILGKF